MFSIESITGSVHDTSYGGYPYKITVTIKLSVKEFNRLCPTIGKSRQSITGRVKVPRDLGNLVLNVNNALYKLNPNIPAYNPSIDSQGSSRAKGGYKTMEFVYFLNDWNRAERLGFKVRRLKNGECISVYGDFIKIA